MQPFFIGLALGATLISTIWWLTANYGREWREIGVITQRCRVRPQGCDWRITYYSYLLRESTDGKRDVRFNKGDWVNDEMIRGSALYNTQILPWLNHLTDELPTEEGQARTLAA